MEDLKIRVNSEAESKEAQELFFELGYKWFSCGNQVQHLKQSCSSGFGYLVAWSSGCFTNVIQCGCGNEDAKEITLPELRDLVVLNRNDVNDRNVTDPEPEYSADLYLDSKGDLFVFHNPTQTWKESNLNGMDSFYKVLKPITKEPAMKEYLRKNNDGEYILEVTDEREAQEPHAKHWIEIPEGANFAWKSDGKYVFFTALEMGYRDAAVVWQRHTLPEELPFIDDEPKITTAKGDELDYIAKTHDMRDRYDGESDEDYRYQLEHYISRKEPSLNDQYAEIEAVRQSQRKASETADPTIKETLNQRQEQYGSFEDVATATQDLLKILEKTGLKSLPSMHKEALHMICSKMVRIVNGDHNFIESWHDIAGYATLMENELRVTDGATNSRLTYQKVINGKLQDI